MIPLKARPAGHKNKIENAEAFSSTIPRTDSSAETFSQRRKNKA
jgi:hypothetical protein